MRNLIQGGILFAAGLLAAGLIGMIAAPPRGEPVQLAPVPSPAPIRVHVGGAVSDPGVFRMPADSRVEDAVAAAGGLLPEAELRGLNLAARLEDGSRIEIASIEPVGPAGGGQAGGSADAAGLVQPQEPPGGIVVDLNTATRAELESLSGIGPATAEKIIAYREENGPFNQIEDIVNVSGIGPATFEKIKAQISVAP